MHVAIDSRESGRGALVWQLVCQFDRLAFWCVLVRGGKHTGRRRQTIVVTHGAVRRAGFLPHWRVNS